MHDYKFSISSLLAAFWPALSDPSPKPEDELVLAVRADNWRTFPSTSSQYFPIFIGASVRQLMLGGAPAKEPRLPESLRALGETQAKDLLKTLKVQHAEFQAWPTQGWDGQPNWVFARWRAGPTEAWQWLTQPATDDVAGEDGEKKPPMLPERLVPSEAADHKRLFADFLEFDSLYQQPMFGNCVFVDKAGGGIVLAWPDPEDRAREETRLSTAGLFDAYCMNQPPRFNWRVRTFTLKASETSVEWPSEIVWQAAPAPQPPPVSLEVLTPKWPADLAEQFKKDVYIAAGEVDARFPISGATHRFVKRGSFQPDHDMERFVDYAEERYRELGIKTVRQRFTWRGIGQSNLIAIIPGTERGAPVVLADHFDAACEEDTFVNTHERVTTEGADDNATATALLFAAGETLKDAHPKRDIWLLHLTGEEFPSDGLGARYFLLEMLKNKQDFHAVIVSDFIGWHQKDKRTYQISPTSAPGSEHIAALSLDAQRLIAPDIQAVYQPRNAERNSVFQTDLQVFEYFGYPGILFNENMNYSEMSDSNPNYHQSTDVSANIDFDFASSIAKVAIETTLRAAND